MTDANDVAEKLEARADAFDRGDLSNTGTALDRTAAALLRSLTERVKELEEALEPFARLGAMLEMPMASALFPDASTPNLSALWLDNGEPVTLTYGDLRAARRARGEP